MLRPGRTALAVLCCSLAVGGLVASAAGDLDGIDEAATARSLAARREPVRIDTAPVDQAGRAVVDLVNAERARRGLPAVDWHPQVASAAAAHSADMAANGHMTHVGSDGSDTGTRLTRAGFAWGSWAENVGVGQPDAGAMFEAWMNSPPHRANILGSFRYAGVAEVMGDGQLYWTLVLAN